MTQPVRMACVLLLAGGCTAARSYRLPLDPERAAETYPALVATAGALGYEVVEEAPSILVRIDEITRVRSLLK